MRLTLCCAALLFAGCVSSGKYEQLETQHAALQKDLDAKSTENDAIKAKLNEFQKKQQNMEKVSVGLQQVIEQTKAQVTTVEGEKQKALASAQEMRVALEELAKRKAESDKREQEFKELLGKFRSLIDSGKLNVKIVEGRMVVMLPTDILFPAGSAALSKDGKAAVREVAVLLASIADKRFQVEGHTDNLPISTAQFPSNWELASARALAVVRTMIEGGMPPPRISAASYSEYRPLSSNADREGRASNRRVEIVLEADLSKIPGDAISP